VFLRGTIAFDGEQVTVEPGFGQRVQQLD
jgi:hypothetical protein